MENSGTLYNNELDGPDKDELIERLLKQNDRLRLECESLRALNLECMEFLEKKESEASDDILTLTEIKAAFKKLQAQNEYLKNENKVYKSKIDKITGTWYGKLAIKCYHVLKKILKVLKLK